MREIKFRGYSCKYKEWVVGLLTRWHDGDYQIQSENLTMTLTISPKSIGQYTGIIDRHGKKVFEGDIVNLTVRHYEDCSREELISTETMKGTIVFDYGSFGIKNFEDNGFRLLVWFLSMDYDIEIIGNAYENPDLLKV